MSKSFTIKYSLLVLLFTFGVPSVIYAQSFNVNFLFNPGVTYGGEYMMPASINGSSDFQLSKYKLQFSQPLKTKIGVSGLDLKKFSFKKLDAKASQLFLNYDLSLIQPRLTGNGKFHHLYKAGFGFTAITASFRKGIWMYSANLYATESEQTFKNSFTPNFRGYLTNIKTKNLRTFYIFGGGLLFHQGQFIPFPILGVSTKLAPKLRGEFILPVQVKFNYMFNQQISLDAVVHYNGINTVFREGSAYSNNDQTINVRQLKTYLALNAKISKHFKFRLEAGYASMQRFYAWEAQTATSIGAAPFLGASINYNFGKSVFGNFMKQAE